MHAKATLRRVLATTSTQVKSVRESLVPTSYEWHNHDSENDTVKQT